MSKDRDDILRTLHADDVMRDALVAMAEASDEIVEGPGDAIREFSRQFVSHLKSRPERPETSFDDPDHWNDEKGGNRLSDDYWRE